MATLERGTVKFFDSRKEKRFGFLLMPSGEEVFFHFNDGAPVEVTAAAPIMLINVGASRDPQKGDRLLFERAQNRKGAKAAPWCFSEDWELAEKEITARPVYRLIKQTGGFRTKKDPVVEWEGHNLDELRQKFGSVNLGLHYNGGTSEWVKHWFAEKTPEGWHNLENQCDPRKIFLQTSRVIKQRMPLTMAKSILAAATRNTLVDHAVGDCEVYWNRGNRIVAEAYYSGSSGESVTMKKTFQYDQTTFKGEEGKQLIDIGEPGTVEINDAGNQRDW